MRLFLLCFFLFPINSAASVLYISVSGNEVLANTHGQYFEDLKKKIATGDRVIIISSIDGNILIDYDLENYKLYKAFKDLNKGFLSNNLDKKLQYISSEKFSNLISNSNLGVSTKNKNIRLNYTMNSLIQLIDIYKIRYSNINVAFLADAHLHQSDDYDFSEGIPSAAFLKSYDDEELDLADNPFYFLRKIERIDSNLTFDVIYDQKHPMDSKYAFFFDALLKKYFGVGVNVYSNRVNDKSKPSFDNTLDLYPKQLLVVKEGIETPCETDDSISASFDQEVYQVTIKLSNPCRANRLVNFNFKNDIKNILKNKAIFLDENGEGKTDFSLSIGKNIISYNDLNNSNPQVIFERDIGNKEDNIEVIARSGHDEVEIAGRNFLRENGSLVKITSLKTGASKTVKVENGFFRAVFPVDVGLHEFQIEQLDGTIISKSFNASEECLDKFQLDQDHLILTGDLKGKITNQCRKTGSFVEMIYFDGPKTIDPNYKFIVNNQGEANVYIPLFREVNEVFYVDFDGNKQLLDEFFIENFDSLVKASIYWSEPVFLNLHIFEPNFNIIEPVDADKYSEGMKDGHVYIDNSRSTGQLNDLSPSLQKILNKEVSSYSQTYVAKFTPSIKGEISFYVDYPFRHTDYYQGNKNNVVIPKYCNKRAQGGLIFSYKLLLKGTLERGERFFPPAKCILVNDPKTGKDSWQAIPEDKRFLFLQKATL